MLHVIAMGKKQNQKRTTASAGMCARTQVCVCSEGLTTFECVPVHCSARNCQAHIELLGCHSIGVQQLAIVGRRVHGTMAQDGRGPAVENQQYTCVSADRGAVNPAGDQRRQCWDERAPDIETLGRLTVGTNGKACANTARRTREGQPGAYHVTAWRHTTREHNSRMATGNARQPMRPTARRRWASVILARRRYCCAVATLCYFACFIFGHKASVAGSSRRVRRGILSHFEDIPKAPIRFAWRKANPSGVTRANRRRSADAASPQATTSPAREGTASRAASTRSGPPPPISRNTASNSSSVTSLSTSSRPTFKRSALSSARRKSRPHNSKAYSSPARPATVSRRSLSRRESAPASAEDSMARRPDGGRRLPPRLGRSTLEQRRAANR